MIDFIKFTKKNLSDAEMKTIINKSRLSVHTKDNFKYYENGKLKDMQGGFYIAIDKDKNLKLVGSLHKYYSFLKTGKNTNFDRFTMYQAKETIFKLLENKGIEPLNVLVTDYEIGINLCFDVDVSKFLNSVYSIGDLEEKKLYINPLHRKERTKTTEMHRNFKVVYKMYDKIFEIKDKKGVLPKDANINILRIETIYKRIDKTYLLDFFIDSNLIKIQDTFFKKWDKLNFDYNIDAPKGTHKSKIELAKEIIKQGTEPIKEKYEKLYKQNAISFKIYRGIYEFINNWNATKNDFKKINLPLFEIWAKTYNAENQVLTISLNNFLICNDKN